MAVTGVPRRLLAAAGGLALAWLVPLGAHAVGGDAVLPPLLLIGVAGLLRGAGTWLDRLVCGVALLFGTTVAAGLLLSVWPWGLHPVPVAGFAFSALVLLAAARPPVRAARMCARHWLTAAAAAVVAVVVIVPFAVRDAGARLGVLMPGEDLTRHFLLVDLIGLLDGYAFLSADRAAAYLDDRDAGTVQYPQGAHFGFALLDRFWRSSTENPPPAAGMDFLIWACVAGYLFLALAVAWGVVRVAGPGPAAWTVAPLVAVVAGYVYVSDPITVLLRGFPNQLLGLAFAAVLTAVLVRPLSRLGEQACLVAALLVGISFTYFMYLPWALAAVAVWLWVRRRALLRRWRLVGGALVVAGAVAAVPPAVSAVRTSQQLQLAGTALPVDRVLAAAVLGAVLAALVVARRRGPRWWLMLGTVGAALGFTLGILVFQLVTVGRPIYYFEKALHLALVVALVNLGALARLLPRLDAPDRRGLLLRAVAAAVVVAFMAAGGGAAHTTPLGPGPRFTLGVDRGSTQGGRDALALARLYPDGAGAVTVDLARTPYANFFATMFAAAMQRRYRDGAAWVGLLWPEGTPRSLADLERQVAGSDARVRFMVADPRASFLVVDPARPNRPATGTSAPNFGDPAAPTNIEAAEHLRARFPDRVEVVYLR